MTAEELIEKFNSSFGMREWPKAFLVDMETYGNCCQFVFNRLNEATDYLGQSFYYLALGPNKGLMFKNVELIIKKASSETQNVTEV